MKDKVDKFENNSYLEQDKDLERIINQLLKESSMQEGEYNRMEKRIKELQNDIDRYNGKIIGLAVSIGMSVAVVVGSFFVSKGFCIVVTLFVLPAVAVCVADLVKTVAKMKQAKAEIEVCGESMDQCAQVINGLSKLKKTPEDLKKQSAGIKDDLTGVNAPWIDLNTDINAIYQRLTDGEFTDYEGMKTAFEEIKTQWVELQANLQYLDLNKSVKKVVAPDEITADVDDILAMAQQSGMSVDDFVAA